MNAPDDPIDLSAASPEDVLAYLRTPPPDPIPGIRTHLRSASEAEIERLNEREGRSGVARYEPLMETLKAIVSVRSPSVQQLLVWATHPDEAVPLSLLQRGLPWMTTIDEYELVVRTLIGRALRDAGDDVWTPLISEIFAMALWPKDWNIAKRSSVPPEETRLPTWAEYIETRVVLWIRAQSTETLVAALRAADSYELARTIALYAPVLDTELIEELIRRKPEAAEWLIERPDGVPKAAGERALESLVNLAKQLGAVELERKIMGSLVPHGYRDLQAAGFVLNRSQAHELLDAIRGDTEQQSDDEDRVNEHRWDAAFGILAGYLTLTGDEEIALQFMEAAGRLNEPRYARNLFEPHDDKPTPFSAAVALAALDRFGNAADVCEAVAAHPVLRNDPAVRTRLRQTGSWRVARHLIEDGRPEDFADLFGILARQRPSAAAHVLETKADLAKMLLNRSDLLPLLRAQDRNTRMRALMVLGELDETKERPRGRIQKILKKHGREI